MKRNNIQRNPFLIPLMAGVILLLSSVFCDPLRQPRPETVELFHEIEARCDAPRLPGDLENCEKKLAADHIEAADYSPGGREREPRPVTGSGEVKLSLYLVDFEKFQDYDSDYEPDIPPGPDEGWYPPISCTLTDDRNGVVVGSPKEVPCYTPGSISPMPPDACIMAKARTAEMIAVVPYDKVENTPGVSELNE
jgi:hypothetical protein